MSFQIKALDPHPFSRLFAMSDDQLARNMAVRMLATKQPGFPCRVSLADAEIGDPLLLVNYEHQGGASPYRAAHAVFVREGVAAARPKVGEVPECLRSRTLSLRAFDAQAMIVAASLVDGAEAGPELDRLLEHPDASYIHIHFAKYGCYAARADRADQSR